MEIHNCKTFQLSSSVLKNKVHHVYKMCTMPSSLSAEAKNAPLTAKLEQILLFLA